MAKARLYSANVEAIKNPSTKNKTYLANLKGQAKIVFDELLADLTPRLAVDIDKLTAPKFVTRQDTLRVTLYYIIIFRGKGLVKATENDDVEENAFAGLIPAENKTN